MESMTTQLTFQGLLDALAAVPRDAIVKISGFGVGDTPGVLFRHRPFVDGLCITPTIARAALDLTVAEFVDFLKETGPHKTWRGHGRDGFIDRHPAGPETPMWVGTPHELSFNAVTSIEMKKGFAVIRTTNLAPVQGPSIQRVSDEEAINRMRVEHRQRTGEDTVFAPHIERHLLNMLTGDRTRVLLNLEEARQELASFEASLQAKKDRVAKLERDAVRHDYLLGIRDDLPGTDPVAYAHESCPEHGTAAPHE
jgi:hypothetical protein